MINNNKKDYDLYRDSILRYLGYSNEVGEAFRPLVSKHLVNLSYAVAVFYVFADTADKAMKEQKKLESTPTKVAIVTGDVLTWQMLASVIVPGFTINRVAKGTRYLVKRYKVPNSKYIPTAVGLACIPFIIKPIDKMIDYVMDNTYRKYIKYE